MQGPAFTSTAYAPARGASSSPAAWLRRRRGPGWALGSRCRCGCLGYLSAVLVTLLLIDAALILTTISSAIRGRPPDRVAGGSLGATRCRRPVDGGDDGRRLRRHRHRWRSSASRSSSACRLTTPAGYGVAGSEAHARARRSGAGGRPSGPRLKLAAGFLVAGRCCLLAGYSPARPHRRPGSRRVGAAHASTTRSAGSRSRLTTWPTSTAGWASPARTARSLGSAWKTCFQCRQRAGRSWPTPCRSSPCGRRRGGLAGRSDLPRSRPGGFGPAQLAFLVVGLPLAADGRRLAGPARADLASTWSSGSGLATRWRASAGRGPGWIRPGRAAASALDAAARFAQAELGARSTTPEPRSGYGDAITQRLRRPASLGGNPDRGYETREPGGYDDRGFGTGDEDRGYETHTARRPAAGLYASLNSPSTTSSSRSRAASPRCSGSIRGVAVGRPGGLVGGRADLLQLLHERLRR